MGLSLQVKVLLKGRFSGNLERLVVLFLQRELRDGNAEALRAERRLPPDQKEKLTAYLQEKRHPHIRFQLITERSR